MKKYLNGLLVLTVSALCLTVYSSCKKAELVTSTTDDVNILSYLQRNPDQFSELVKVIDKSGYSGFLNAYGSYTFFAPTNDAFKTYLQDVGKASVDQLTQKESQDIVKFHVMEDTITTNAFKDGKLPLVTMYGQYLLTGVTNKDNVSSYTVNRQALVVKPNIVVGNGYIHSIDHVLKPATKSLAELIEANPNFSIFTEALKATGFYDTLKTISTNPARRWLTVMAETNKALQDAGINNYNDLLKKYSKTGNPRNANDSLYLYVAYHIIPDAQYLADIITAPSHTSLAPLEVLLSKLENEKVLINDITFNGVYEPGVELERANSDVSATNGVLHVALGHFAPKVRVPVRVYWDVGDFPEIRKLPSYFRKQSYTFSYGSIKDITWEKNDAANDLIYSYTTATNFFPFYNDYLTLRLGGTGARNLWYEFRTPILVKGRYKVWVCYRTAKQSGSIGQPGGSNMPVQTYFNGQPLTRVFNFTERRPNLPDGEMEALGWKRYTSNTTLLEMSSRLLGIIDVQVTDRHTLRMEGLPAAGTGQNSNYLDMIQFIPVSEDQIIPRIDRTGALVYQ
jgi:uncharacterized surface protein with fasciclin (FAS1) repeats